MFDDTEGVQRDKIGFSLTVRNEYVLMMQLFLHKGGQSCIRENMKAHAQCFFYNPYVFDGYWTTIATWKYYLGSFHKQKGMIVAYVGKSEIAVLNCIHGVY